MDASELESLVEDKVPEDSFLDYKHGDELKKSDPSLTIRRYVSGFANSEGGILIVGVDEENWEITGAKAPGGIALDKWAATCLADIASYFSPLPRMHVVGHPTQGNVLIVAVGRSAGLVPCIEKRRFTYHLRFNDQTLQVPEYLLSDLVLGRRRRPDLHIATLQTAGFGLRLEPQKNAYGPDVALQFDLECTVENRGLVWAEDVRIGTVSLIRQPAYPADMLNSHLLSYLDVQENDTLSSTRELVHKRYKLGDLEAFTTTQPKIISTHVLSMTIQFELYDYEWLTAIYIVSRDTPPTWYQLNLQVNQDVHNFAVLQPRGELRANGQFMKLTLLSAERPTVAWLNLRLRS